MLVKGREIGMVRMKVSGVVHRLAKGAVRWDI